MPGWKPKEIRPIALKHMPFGWTLRERDLTSGQCAYHGKTLHVPILVEPHALYVFFHEVAHAEKHAGVKRAEHVCEYEAEWYAMTMMRAYGFSVPRKELYDAKDNVWSHVLRDQKRGITISPVVRKWAAPLEGHP